MSLFEDPLRLRIQKRHASLIETITIVGGYHFDLTGKVFRGRKFFDDRDELPYVSILEDVDREQVSSISQRDGISNSEYRLLIQCWTNPDEANPTDETHKLAADVTSVLAGLDTQMPFNDILLVSNYRVEPPLVRPHDEFSDIAYSLQRVVMSVAEDLRIPYDDA